MVLIIPCLLLVILMTMLLFTLLAFVLLLNMSHVQWHLFLIQPCILWQIPCTLHRASTPVASYFPNSFMLSFCAWRMPQFTLAPAAVLRLLILMLLIT